MATATTEAPQELRLRADLIRPLPPQERFLNAMYQYEYVLYGGAAGPGKSHALRWGLVELLLHWASQGHREVRVGLFCETYPSLKDRHLEKISREFPSWLGSLRDTRDRGLGFHLHPQYGGGYIALRNLDEPDKYASVEFAAIAVDELTKNPRQTFDDLRFRKRWPGIEHSPFLAASNPGSIGHGWVKKLWLDSDFSGDDSTLDPATFKFIPARAGDNPYLPASYWATLNSLPPDMRRAMLEGDWNVFAGQAFNEWREQLHVVDPFRIPPDWTCWTATDYGYSAPFCTLWLARTPDKSRIYVYRELYQSGARAQEQAKAIRLASEGETIQQHVADPSMWAKKEGLAGDTLADEYLLEGIHLGKANNDRLAGKGYVHEALAWKEIPGSPPKLVRAPRLQVFRSCRNLIRTLPSLPYDNIRTEDVDTDAEDHPYDALRYGLALEHQQEQPQGITTVGIREQMARSAREAQQPMTHREQLAARRAPEGRALRRRPG